MLGRHRRRAHHDLGTVGPEELDLLRRDLVGHDEHAPVALACGGDGKPDAGVARGGFYDRPAGRQLPRRLGGGDHGKRRAVLHAPAGVEELELGEEMTAQVTTHPVETDQGRATDQIEERVGHLHRRAVVGCRE